MGRGAREMRGWRRRGKGRGGRLCENVSRLKFRRVRVRARVRVYARAYYGGRSQKIRTGIGKYSTFHLGNANCYPRHAGHFITEFPGVIRASRNPPCVVTPAGRAEEGEGRGGEGRPHVDNSVGSASPIEKETKMNSAAVVLSIPIVTPRFRRAVGHRYAARHLSRICFIRYLWHGLLHNTLKIASVVIQTTDISEKEQTFDIFLQSKLNIFTCVYYIYVYIYTHTHARAIVINDVN